MEMNGGFLVTKIKQLGDRIFEKILSEKNSDAFNGAQGRRGCELRACKMGTAKENGTGRSVRQKLSWI